MLSSTSDRGLFAYMEGFTTCAAFAALGTMGLLDELAVNTCASPTSAPTASWPTPRCATWPSATSSRPPATSAS